MKKISRNYFWVIIALFFFYSSAGISQNSDLSNVKSGKFDMGKMWTFDHPPVDYFAETYGFRPTKEWLDHVQMAAIRFATYCSSSFVSEDGLIMTNHHCGRESVSAVEKKGEDLHKTGFLAMKLEDERPVPGLFVDQLVRIIDITKDIQDATETGTTQDEKLKNKDKKVKELETKYSNETGLRAQVVTLFSGGQYSCYLYKRYNDIRIVFAPEDQAGFFGGDYDNFTYPRYNFDCTFFRAYENGKPMKTEHYYKWSPKGAGLNEPVFVIGNPGRTSRLNTIAQLEYKRDYQYPDILAYLDYMIADMQNTIKNNPEKEKELSNTLFSLSNSQKVFIGSIKGLKDPYLMARKGDFEMNFKKAIQTKPDLNEKYGKAWDEIEKVNKERGAMYNELYLYSVLKSPRNTSFTFSLANDIVSSVKADGKYDASGLKSKYSKLDKETDRVNMSYLLNTMVKKFGNNNENVKALTGGNEGEAAFNYALSKTILMDESKTTAFVGKTKEEILASDDPFISFFVKTGDRQDEVMKRADELRNLESYNRELIGRAAFEVFGNTIPPDATFTLRISDGVLKSYPYNGTIAPPKTTFYGYYDRYYGFNKEYPYSLPDRWLNPPKEFNLNTPINFISTCDIIGGNSGSPLINKNGEIIGLAFDGNIESLTDEFIYFDDVPHTVSVDSEGLLEAVKNLYKVDRLASELRNGKIAK